MNSLKQLVAQEKKDKRCKKKVGDMVLGQLTADRLLKKLGSQITAKGEGRVTVDEVLSLSESVAPSIIFDTGGALFDQFFLGQGSVTCKERLNALVKRNECDEEEDNEDEVCSDVACLALEPTHHDGLTIAFAVVTD